MSPYYQQQQVYCTYYLQPSGLSSGWMSCFGSVLLSQISAVWSSYRWAVSSWVAWLQRNTHRNAREPVHKDKKVCTCQCLCTHMQSIMQNQTHTQAMWNKQSSRAVSRDAGGPNTAGVSPAVDVRVTDGLGTRDEGGGEMRMRWGGWSRKMRMKARQNTEEI